LWASGVMQVYVLPICEVDPSKWDLKGVPIVLHGLCALL